MRIALTALERVGKERPGLATARQRRIDSVRKLDVLIIGLLFFQYVLGMGNNLFVEFPSRVAGVNPLDSALTSGPYLVAFHILVGIALGVAAIAVLTLSALARSRNLAILAMAGLGSILLAGESGIEFVLGWYSDDLFSFLMSLGFVLAFALYFVLFWYARVRLSVTLDARGPSLANRLGTRATNV